MMSLLRLFLLVSFNLLLSLLPGQNVLDWNEEYTLTLDDFQNKGTQIGQVNIYSLQTATGMSFSFQMSNAEFMFTKNFNSKVSCTFTRDASLMVAPDSIYALNLLNFARFEFDLAELYARKLRKKLFEAKKTFSSGNFFQPIFEDLQAEYNQRHAEAAKASDIGQLAEVLIGLHGTVNLELREYNDYCKDCKPPKISRRN